MLNYPSTDWMSEEELQAWEAVAEAARAIFRLPVLHPADNTETVRDIHDIQNRLLARAAYPDR